jgi:VIT1/CCC1 family predicted Fe2+/Mn2+ transporter
MPMKELESWEEEKQSAYLYRIIAEVENGTRYQALFTGLASEAERQAGIWADAITRRGGGAPGAYDPNLRTRIVSRMVRLFGTRAMRGILTGMKVRGMSVFSSRDPGHPTPTIASGAEQRHRWLGGGGNLRAAVFGVNDGLISNASLLMGIAGAQAEPGTIVLTGLAGLASGAFAMAAGEYVSMRSQRELYEYQIELEREELAEYPEAEAAELALIYRAKGIPEADAQQLAKTLIGDPQQALSTLAREELGLNPDELGSAWGAAISSFCSFASGALIPLLPFLFAAGNRALVASILGTAAALMLVGAALSLFTGRSAWRSGLRMLAIGALAGGVTYTLGRMMGVSLG